MKNLWKTVIALGFAAGMGLAGLSAQTTEGEPIPEEPTTEETIRTVKPEEVPIMDDLHLIATIPFAVDAQSGYVDKIYDVDDDGTIDALFTYEYSGVSSNGIVDLILYGYVIDEDGDGHLGIEEVVIVDYSGYLLPELPRIPDTPEIQEAPQLPDYYDLWNEFFDLGEESEVGV
jgi:hypothetical protein